MSETPKRPANSTRKDGSKNEPDSLRAEKPAANAPGETAKATDSVPMSVGPFPILPVQFGRYQIQRELGKGQMGAVYLAMDTELDRPVALKVARTSSSGSAKLLKRMEVEAKAAAIVDHPQICKVYDAGEIDGIRFIALQYVDGENLKQFLKRTGRRQKPKEAVRLVLQILRALESAHEHGIIHRDLKPENVMLNKKFQPVIMDFGLARRTTSSSDAGLTQGMIVGTAAYMSPEQAVGKPESIDHRSDLYAVGVMLFEMLTGQWPFSGGAMEVMGRKCVQDPPSPISVNPDLSPQLSEVCHKMIAQKKEDRFKTCEAAVRALEEIDLSGRSMATSISGSSPSPFEFVHLETPLPELKTKLKNKSKQKEAVAEEKQPIVSSSVSIVDWLKITPVALRWFALGGCGVVAVIAAILFLRSGRRETVVIAPPPSIVAGTASIVPRRSFCNKNAIWLPQGDELVQWSLDGVCQLVFGDPEWTDYDFRFQAKIIRGNNAIGLTYRHTEKGFAEFKLGRDNDEWESATSTVNGKEIWNRGHRGKKLESDRWCDLRVSVRGTRCECFRDGESVFQYDDQKNLKGAVGLWMWQSCVRFREIKVTDPTGKVLFEGLPDLPTETNGWPPDFKKQLLNGDPSKTDLKTTPSGLKYRILRAGSGPKPNERSTVGVHHKGSLDDGTVFENTYTSGVSLTLPMSKLISGWKEGLQLISSGGMIELEVPSKLGYGSDGSPPKIPPNATLHFVIELISVH